MKVTIGEITTEKDYDMVCVNVGGLCSKWEDGEIKESTEVHNDVPSLLISWQKTEPNEGIVVPCFMTVSKKRDVFECMMKANNAKENDWWKAIGVGLILQSNGS